MVEDKNKEKEKNIEISFEEGETEERPDYGGNHERKYTEDEVVGYNEYVDTFEGVQYIFHEDKGITLEENGNIDAREVSLGMTGNGVIFEDANGEEISPRIDTGSMWLNILSVDSIIFAGDEKDQIRKGTLDTFDLENSIDSVGLLQPIHVVPFGEPIGYEKDEEGNEMEDLPLYSRYALVHGRRRLEAVLNLGGETILALVDTTIPYPLISVYQAFEHYGKPYTFSEKMAYVQMLRLKQPQMSPDLIETALGYKSGELPKAEYIDQMKVDFLEIYTKVENGKFTIDQGFKAIEKEQNKREKELEEGDEPEDESGDGSDDLDGVDIDVNTQELGNRTILDAPIRRKVEARDNSMCQTCGYGEGIPDLSNMFSVHHMVPVQYGGSDSPENLILVCQNCHKMIHDYENGRIMLSKETYEEYKDIQRVVVLGNILKKTRQKAIEAIKKQDATVARKLEKNVLTVGQALVKSKVKINAEEDFKDGSPYKAYMKATNNNNLKFRSVQGELGELKEPEEEEEENIDEMTLEDLAVDVEIEQELGKEKSKEEATFSIEIDEADDLGEYEELEMDVIE